jgi:ABC-type multidrug transport system permease subunit
MPETSGPTKIHRPIIELTIVRTKEFLRETEAIFWVFGFPLILALALGFAFRAKPPDRIPIGIVAGASAQTRMAQLSRSPALQPHIYSASEGQEALRRGRISLLVEGDSAPVYRFDPTRPQSRAARIEADDSLQKAAGRKDVFQAAQVEVKEQGSRYIDFLMPGLLGMNLMGTGIWGIAFTVANARMKKLLKRLVATPMRKSEYLLSQFLSRLVFLTMEVSVLVAFGWLVFGVRVNGSLPLLALLCLVGGFSFSGVGVLVASRARSIEAVSGITNLVMMPMWLCSGVFFSYERFPDKIKPLIRLLPLTALNDALRGVINDSMGFAQIAPQLLILLAWGLACFFLGLKIFRWQ